MAQGADYRIDLSIYNGPLDLLLYLIKEREVDIHDIPIAEITGQFLSHLEVVKRIDLERAGDFLLVAATLMLIKSRMLLPRAGEEDDLGDEFDPRTDLVRQLLEYKQFKDASRELDASRQARSARFEGGLRPLAPDAPDAGKLLEDLGVDDLLLAFERMMRETLAEVDHQVFGEVLPLRELEVDLMRLLRLSGGTLPFREFFRERRDRYYIVSVLLCLLEMLKERLVHVERGPDLLDLAVCLVPAEGEVPVNRMP